MSERYITANGVSLAYDEFGDTDGPVILLIMGLGTQMIGWPEPFCEALADAGFRVIRYDNRDIGLSQKMDGAVVPGLLKMVAYSKVNLPIKVPYRLFDMAEDAVGLMDALDIPAAHLVGASMGGMIAQLVASYFPFRTLSLTSIMSTSGRRSLPGADRKVMMHMARRPNSTDRDILEAYSMKTWRLIGSPGYPPSDEELRTKIARSYDRSWYPSGYARQAAAIMASGDRVEELRKIIAPTLVIHGKDDLLVPVAGGIDTAKLIKGATLKLFEGMGHDLPAALLPEFTDLISNHARQALQASA